MYCPVCAASEFGYRPDFAATYAQAWELIPNEPSQPTTDGV